MERIGEGSRTEGGISATGGIEYNRLVQHAMRGLLRSVLARVASEGLPGAHHFFITFATSEGGVKMPLALRRKYPEEMTIVLQNQFEDLEVDEAAFSVTVRFGGAPTRLIVPFESVVAFVDPSVSFGVRLKDQEPTGSVQSDEVAWEAPSDKIPADKTAKAGATVVPFRPRSA
jgi:hypothetical protein